MRKGVKRGARVYLVELCVCGRWESEGEESAGGRGLEPAR